MGVVPAGDAVSKQSGGLWKRLKQLVELPDLEQRTTQMPAESSPSLQQFKPGGGKQLWSKLRRLAGRQQRKGSPAAAQERMGATCVASSFNSFSSPQPLHSAAQKPRGSWLARVPVTGRRQTDSPLVSKSQSKSQPNLRASMAAAQHGSEQHTSQSRRSRSAQAPAKSARGSLGVAAKDNMRSTSHPHCHSATSMAVMRQRRASSTSLLPLMTGRHNGKMTGFTRDEDSILSSRASVREMLDIWHAAQPAYLQQSKQVFIDPDEYGGLTRYREQQHWWPQDTVEIGQALEDSVFDNIPTSPESKPGFVQDTPKLSRIAMPASTQQQLQQPQPGVAKHEFKASMSFAKKPVNLNIPRYWDEAGALAVQEMSAAIISEESKDEGIAAALVADGLAGTSVALMPSPRLATGSSFLTSLAMSLVLEEVLAESMAEGDFLRCMDSLNLDSSCMFVTATGAQVVDTG